MKCLICTQEIKKSEKTVSCTRKHEVHIQCTHLDKPYVIENPCFCELTSGCLERNGKKFPNTLAVLIIDEIEQTFPLDEGRKAVLIKLIVSKCKTCKSFDDIMIVYRFVCLQVMNMKKK